jgi:hypothetical protein
MQLYIAAKQEFPQPLTPLSLTKAQSVLSVLSSSRKWCPRNNDKLQGEVLTL